jgi:hypothetical protein
MQQRSELGLGRNHHQQSCECEENQREQQEQPRNGGELALQLKAAMIHGRNSAVSAKASNNLFRKRPQS